MCPICFCDEHICFYGFHSVKTPSMDYCGRLKTGDAVIIAPACWSLCISKENRLHMAPRRNAENENENGGDHMSKYLVEESKKNGLFEPYDPQRYCLVSKEQLSKMISQKFSWVVFSARWVNLDLSPLEQLKKSLRRNRGHRLRAHAPTFFSCSLTTTERPRKIGFKTFLCQFDQTDTNGAKTQI